MWIRASDGAIYTTETMERIAVMPSRHGDPYTHSIIGIGAGVHAQLTPQTIDDKQAAKWLEELVKGMSAGASFVDMFKIVGGANAAAKCAADIRKYKQDLYNATHQVELLAEEHEREVEELRAKQQEAIAELVETQ